MAALARVFRIEEVEEDPSLVEGATKLCFDCDEDNPRAVDRATCETCGGSGQQPLAVAEIAKELRAAKKSPNSERANGGGYKEAVSRKKIKAVEDDDLFLEY